MYKSSTFRTAGYLIGYVHHGDSYRAILQCTVTVLVGERPSYTAYVPIKADGSEGLPRRECPALDYTRDNPPPEFAAHNPFADYL